MKKSHFFSSRSGTLLLVVTFVGFAFLLNRWHNQLEASEAKLVKEYRIDTMLSKQKQEYLTRYQSILSSGQPPKIPPLHQNEWVQVAQTLTAEKSLTLKELKPLYKSGKSGDQVSGLVLVIEGTMINVARLLHEIGQNNHLVFCQKVNIVPSFDQADQVRAQLTLSQFSGG